MYNEDEMSVGISNNQLELVNALTGFTKEITTKGWKPTINGVACAKTIYGEYRETTISKRDIMSKIQFKEILIRICNMLELILNEKKIPEVTLRLVVSYVYYYLEDLGYIRKED